MRERSYSRKLGLALGAGGGRGGVHVGVLKVLERHGVPVHCIAGSSIGALIGGLYAATLDARNVDARLLEYLKSDLFSSTQFDILDGLASKPQLSWMDRFSSFLRKELVLTLTVAGPSLVSQERFLETIEFFVGGKHLDETRIPFAAVATDLETGEEVVLREGSMVDAVYASCSYPGVVEARRLGGRLLVDGGISSMVPVEAARQLGADVIMAVDVEPHIQAKLGELCALDVILRAEDILLARAARRAAEGADILLHPETGEAAWYDVGKAPAYVALGEEATQEKLPQIEAELRGG